MRPEDWMRLLLITEQTGPARIAQPLCSEEPIEWKPLPSSCEVQTATRVCRRPCR
jgi:hypothetical protein